jgi:cystathionine beta-lyase/cystathionine gamma-synthase
MKKLLHALGTRAIHAGQSPDPSTGAIMTPIYATSTYVQQSPGVPQVVVTAGATRGLERYRRFLTGKNPLAARRAAEAIKRQLVALVSLRTSDALGPTTPSCAN